MGIGINDRDTGDVFLPRKVRESRQELRRFMREVKRSNPTAKVNSMSSIIRFCKGIKNESLDLFALRS